MINTIIRLALGCHALLALLVSLPVEARCPDWRCGEASEQRSAARSQTWVEEWDPATRRWVLVQEQAPAGNRFTYFPRVPNRKAAPLAVFGPFVVVDQTKAALMGTTDGDSPADFLRMLAAFPDIAKLDLIDAPGTINDVANLKLGRLIREAGLATHVPSNGSARSGAVELFLAGTTRSMEPGALFAVHSWRDQSGREPRDFPPEDPVNRLYTAYYEEMGMSAAEAQAFYAMTNSVPHSRALWFGPEVMEKWIADGASDAAPRDDVVRLAYDYDRLLMLAPPLSDPQIIPMQRFARNH